MRIYERWKLQTPELSFCRWSCRLCTQWAPEKATSRKMVRYGYSRSFKVIEIGTSGKSVCDFLLVFHCKCAIVPIFYRFRVITTCWSKICVSPLYRNREVAGSTHTRSTTSNLEQVANLLYAQANSASYPQQDEKWVVATATGWRPSVANWSSGVSASCTVGPTVL